MQSKLDSFFKKNRFESNRKKYFIYDPENTIAFFSNIIDPKDIFLSSRCKGPSSVDLYLRPKTNSKSKPLDNSIDLFELEHPSLIRELSYFTDKVPLLKSNLQKAIRRGNKKIAIYTTILLLKLDSNALFRRLPIIMIEDVTLFDSMDILMWWCIASASTTATTSNSYKFSSNDFYILINIVSNLCDCLEFFNYDPDIQTESTINYNEIQKDYSHTLGLYYRKLYGGMKGDMRMLDTAIEYFSRNPLELKRTTYISLSEFKIDPEEHLEIIPEAIDFHCYPQILKELNKEFPYLTEEQIREMIWFSESAINIRKPTTIEKSNIYREIKAWNQVKKELDILRSLLV
jgi:hypothetical protein